MVSCVIGIVLFGVSAEEGLCLSCTVSCWFEAFHRDFLLHQLNSKEMTSFAAPTRLIAIDIDGTLLPTSGLRISERNREALLRAEAEGIHIVVATGRRQAYAIPVLELAGLAPETIMISSNGTVTRTFSGQRIDRWLLPVATARALCGELRLFGGRTVFTFDREGPGELVVESLEALESKVDQWVEQNRPYIREVRPLELAFDTEDAPVQGMVCGTVEQMRNAERRLNTSDFAGLIETHRTEYPEALVHTGRPAAGLLERRGDRASCGQPGHSARRDHGYWRQLQRRGDALLRWPAGLDGQCTGGVGGQGKGLRLVSYRDQ